MRKLFVAVVLVGLLAIAGAASAQEAQSFGVGAPMTGPAADTVPTIVSDMTKDGFVPTGPDGTLVPATVRGFDPGNGKDATFGTLQPMAAPKSP